MISREDDRRSSASNGVWSAHPIADRLTDPAVLEAVTQSLPGAAATAKSADYWCWKHIDNVFGRSTGTLGLAADGREVVGVRCLMRWKFHNAGRHYRAVRAVDTATAPDWRGWGVFTGLTQVALADLRAESVDLIFNTPNTASGPGYLKMGWRRIGRMPVLIRPLRPLAMARRLIWREQRVQPRPDAVAFGLDGLPTWSALAREPALVELVNSHEQHRGAGGLRTPRSPDYLSWRYGKHPQAEYRVHALRAEHGFQALAVVRPNWRFGLRELVVVELFAREARTDLLRACLRSLARAVRGDYLIAHFSRTAPERQALRACGYLPAPGQGITLYAREVAQPLDAAVRSPDGWDLSLGDLELF